MLQKPEKFDHVILFLAIALTCFGVVMVYSASAVTSAVRYHDGLHFLKRQGGFALAGIALMLGAMCVDYHVWKSSRCSRWWPAWDCLPLSSSPV